MARSKAFTRSSPGEAAFSLLFDFDFFFLHNRQRRPGTRLLYSLLHYTSLGDSSLEFEGAPRAEVVVRGHGPLSVVVVQVMKAFSHASHPWRAEVVTRCWADAARAASDSHSAHRRLLPPSSSAGSPCSHPRLNRF